MSLLKRIRVVAVLAAVFLIGVVGVAAANSGGQEEPPATNGSVVTMTVDTAIAADDDFFLDEDWELSDEEIAEINAETDALVEHLKGQGFDVTVETDELGIRYVDFEDNDELFEAVDEFYEAQFAEEVAGWSDAEKAEWNAGVDEFVAELKEAGIDAETEEIAPGVYDIKWTEELEQALAELDHELFIDDDFSLDEDWELSDEEIAEINAETDALVEHLKGQGFDVTVETDELGIRYVDFEDNDELFEAVDEFYEAQFAEEVAGWSDAEKAEWNAGVDEFVAELKEAGIDAETEEIAPGVYDIKWTEELCEALDELYEDDLDLDDDFDSSLGTDV